MSREAALEGQAVDDFDPREDKVTALILEEDTLQSRLARATIDDGVREEIRLLLADAFLRWRKAVKPDA
jgi:hypothetical protein